MFNKGTLPSSTRTFIHAPPKALPLLTRTAGLTHQLLPLRGRYHGAKQQGQRAMNMKANCKPNQLNKAGAPAARLIAWLVLMLIFRMTEAAASAEDEVRATFDRFVAAQNAHDLK